MGIWVGVLVGVAVDVIVGLGLAVRVGVAVAVGRKVTVAVGVAVGCNTSAILSSGMGSHRFTPHTVSATRANATRV